MTARFRARLLLLVGVGFVLAGGEVLREGNGTLHQLTFVERERDVWQKPEVIIQALDLHPGNTVEDMGSGAGYFSLKLARVVGHRGSVLALDLRRVSLAFLWIRARQQGLRAIRVVHADAASADATGGVVLDAVLIVNTYHELTQPRLALNSVWRSLRPGGRLVIADRGPQSASDVSWQTGAGHEVPSELVEHAVRARGFGVLSVDNHFIEAGPGTDHWWMIVAERPDNPL